MKISETMKRNISLLLLAVVFVILFIGLGSEKDDDGKLNLPISSDDLKDANYQDVVAELENSGFTNVQIKAIDDLVLGWLTKDGEVEDVSVDGYTTFSTGSRYPADTKIIVSYHTFPADEVEEVTETPIPEPTVEIAPAEEVDPTEEAQPAEENQAATDQEIISIDNNEEFATILNAKDPGEPIIKEFALKYAGRTIEFDGNIAYMSYHGDSTTRYDFLISPWVYSETSVSGPNFQFEDCNIFDLNLNGDNIPDALKAGDNLHIVARIENYDETSQLFRLDPIYTEVR